MRIIRSLSILLLAFSSVYGKAQSTAPHFEWAAHIGTNWCYAENFGAKNYYGLNLYKRTLGHGFGVSCSYNISDRFEAKVLAHYSMDKISYSYYSKKTTTGSGKIQLPLQIHYRIGKNVRSYWSVVAGLNLSIESEGESGRITTHPDSLQPIINRTAYTRGGVFPIAQLGITKSWQNRNGRKLELMFIFNKGFKPITSYRLEKFNPYRLTTFDYQGSRVDVMFLWYFKKKQP